MLFSNAAVYPLRPADGSSSPVSTVTVPPRPLRAAAEEVVEWQTRLNNLGAP